MESEAPLRDLEGFFVRLRLAGVGGGSYYVGCITGKEVLLHMMIDGGWFLTLKV